MHHHLVSKLASFIRVTLLLIFFASHNPARAAEPKPKATLTGHTAGVWTGQFSPDSKWLATRSRDGTTRLWDVAAGTSTVIGGRGLPGELAFSTDGSKVILWAVTTKDIYICDVASGKYTTAQGGTDYTLLFAPDGMSHLKMTRTGETILEQLTAPFDTKAPGKSSPMTGMVALPVGQNPGYLFSPDSKHVATKDKDRAITLWSVATGKGRKLDNSAGLWFQFSPRSNLLLAQSGTKSNSFVGNVINNPGVTLYSVATGRPTANLTLDINDGPHTQFAFSPNGASVVSGSARSVRIWNTSTGKVTATLDAAGAPVPHVTYNTDGRLVAGKCQDGATKVWNVASRKIICSIPSESPLLAWSPDGKLLAVAQRDGPVLLFETSALR